MGSTTTLFAVGVGSQQQQRGILEMGKIHFLSEGVCNLSLGSISCAKHQSLGSATTLMFHSRGVLWLLGNRTDRCVDEMEYQYLTR